MRELQVAIREVAPDIWHGKARARGHDGVWHDAEVRGAPDFLLALAMLRAQLEPASDKAQGG